MAEELSLMVNLSFSKGGAKVTRQVSKRVDVAGDGFVHGFQTIGTGAEEEVVQLNEIGNPGWVLIINLDDTNYITVGATAVKPAIKIKAGEFALYRHDIGATMTILAIAVGGNVDIEYIIIED